MFGREVRLASRPRGLPTAEDFEIVSAPVIAPGPEQILVRNLLMSVDPVMRELMSGRPFVAPSFEVGEPLDGGAVGEVIESGSDLFRRGQLVLHHHGWREYSTVDARQATPIATDLAPPGAYLGVLGVPGLTAYVGLFEIAGFCPGDTVYVSAAAGAVGSCVGQFAKLRGAARVIGSTGSADKVHYLIDELGFDAAFNYRDGAIGEQLEKTAPQGIDVYFDNVGGDHLEAALGVMNENGRIAYCGAVSQYNLAEPQPGPRNMFQFTVKRLTMRGFVVFLDHQDSRPRFLADIGPLVHDGRIRYRETILRGLDQAPAALIGLLRGANMGKMLVDLS